MYYFLLEIHLADENYYETRERIFYNTVAPSLPTAIQNAYSYVKENFDLLNYDFSEILDEEPVDA